ncbi:MAG: rod shape-determining protein MreC [Polymorphobacter sp.]|uniref:rod shape-determining protein MreC n=1 Tax=Polymorphobacter sp. TaxID=1909290 RepID=UPI003A893675
MDWTPPPRRSSAMRREQNLAIIGAVVTGAVLTVGLVLMLLARFNPAVGAGLRAAALDVVTPIWTVARAPFDGVAAMVEGAGSYLGAVERAKQLERELAAARAQLQVAQAERVALAQLRRLSLTVEPQRRLVATARLVSATPTATGRTALLSAGRQDGVEPGMPVLSADGLIGRTVDVGTRAARVLLLGDALSRVPVIIVRTRQAALVSGDGTQLLTMTERVGAQDALFVGDRLVTSGEGGIFPPGVPVGTIVDADEPQRVRPAASVIGQGFVRVEGAFAAAASAELGPEDE